MARKVQSLSLNKYILIINPGLDQRSDSRRLVRWQPSDINLLADLERVSQTTALSPRADLIYTKI